LAFHIFAGKGQRGAVQSGIRPHRPARTLRELEKEKQTEEETAGSKTPRITVSVSPLGRPRREPPTAHSWSTAVPQITPQRSALSFIYSFLLHALMTVKHAGTVCTSQYPLPVTSTSRRQQTKHAFPQKKKNAFIHRFSQTQLNKHFS